jgi:ankyrin repeat protein
MLQKALATLPPTLDQTYDRILAGIDVDYSQYALRILQWLTFSARPLSIDEVAEVVAIDTRRDPAFDRDEVLEDPMEVLNICSSLVTTMVDHNSNTWGESPRPIVALAHYSVKEYLVSDRIWIGKAAKYGMREDVCHDAIATSCLGYLLQFRQLELEPDFLESFKLALYSAQFWTRHAKQTGKRTKEMNEAALRLCCEESAYVNCVRLWNPDTPWRDADLQEYSGNIPDPLYYAASLGLIDLLKLLLNKGADINAQGGEYCNALQAALAYGYKEIIILLLNKGTNVNAQGGYYGNALQAASIHGSTDVVALLLGRGADVNAQGEYYGTALQAASIYGYKDVVALLLDRGADVNAQGGHYGTALQAASYNGYKAVVRLLLNRGADVNAQGGHYGTALQAASIHGSTDVVALLLDRGADVNAQRGYYSTALQAALAEGHEEIATLLRSKGAIDYDSGEEDS